MLNIEFLNDEELKLYPFISDETTGFKALLNCFGRRSKHLEFADTSWMKTVSAKLSMKPNILRCLIEGRQSICCE